jgi:hypothetical protein
LRIIWRENNGEGANSAKFAKESVDHLIFRCPIVVFMWAVLRDDLKWRRISKSVKDFMENFLLCKGPKGVGVVWFLFGTVCWTLWLNRNDFILMIGLFLHHVH